MSYYHEFFRWMSSTSLSSEPLLFTFGQKGPGSSCLSGEGCAAHRERARALCHGHCAEDKRGEDNRQKDEQLDQRDAAADQARSRASRTQARIRSPRSAMNA